MSGPVTLRGERVHLEPLTREHGESLWPHARDPEVWRYLTSHFTERGAFDAWLDGRVRAMEEGTALAFAQRDVATGELIGSTSIFAIEREHRTMEIGHTWLARKAWGSGINAEAKLLLLTHSFEALNAVRVQIKTDGRNERSQAAIAALGATREGVLRRQLILPDGHIRDAVVYSIIAEEWPAVRQRVAARAGRTSIAHHE